ncbi:MAG: cytochrome c [Nannocystaceae bacterium]
MHVLRRLTAAVLGGLALAHCQLQAGSTREISGESLYLRHCARCHGPDGTGAEGVKATPDLSRRDAGKALSANMIRRAIKAGKPPKMPAYGEQFLEPSLRSLVAYVRGLSAAAQKK